MGRRLRTSVPQTDKMLVPQWSYLKSFREVDRHFKGKQKENFDARHRVKDLPPIPNETDVWVTSESEPVSGKVVAPADRPRSYVVDTPSGQIKRNHSQLIVVPSENSESYKTTQQPEVETSPPRRIMTRSKTGTAVNLPDRL